MRIKLYTAAATAALMVTSASAYAATITVDTFSTFQAVSDTPAGTQTNSSLDMVAPEAIGGFRSLEVTNTQAGGTDSSNDTSLASDAGLLQFSNSAGARGEGTITYNGMGTDDIDLLQGNTFESSFFLFNLPADPDFQFDGVADITVTVTDSTGSEASFFERIDEDFDPRLFFTDFEGSANFSMVDTLEFFVSTTDTQAEVDGALDSVTIEGDLAPIPLPASGLLLLGGLGGISILRRRRKS